MPGVTARVEGVQRLQLALHSAVDNLRDLPVMRQVSELEAAYVRRYVPRRTGRLVGTVRASAAGNKSIVRVGGRAAPYAAVINYGSRRRGITASNYSARADAAVAARLPGLVGQAITRLIRAKGLA